MHRKSGKMQAADRIAGGARPPWFDAGMPHIWLPYAQMKIAGEPLPVAATRGSRIILSDGRELIDGIASWWTACHGYNHPHIAAAVRHQLDVMPHVMFGGLAHEPALTLARRLAALMPEGLDRVFFSDSGSVAVEVAMKMVVQYWVNKGAPGRTRFVAFNRGYHGDTTGAMAVSDPVDGMHQAFGGLLPRHLFCDLPRDEASLARLSDMVERHAAEVAGIIVEPLVQGAGGMHFHEADVLRRLRTIADRYRTLLIFDEIFTGFGRTGTMFACDAVAPDIVTLSQVAAIAAALGQGLAPCRGMPRVRDVRVKGAIGVVELDRIDDVYELRRRFVAEGVLVRPFGRIVYLTPAFTIPPDELDTLVRAVVRIVGGMRA